MKQGRARQIPMHRFSRLVTALALLASIGIIAPTGAMATQIKGGTLGDMQTLAYNPLGDNAGAFVCRDGLGGVFKCGSVSMWDGKHGTMPWHLLQQYGGTLDVSDIIGVIPADRDLNDGFTETQIIRLDPFTGAGQCASSAAANDNCIDSVSFELADWVSGISPITIGLPDVDDEIIMFGMGLQDGLFGAGIETLTMGAVGNTIDCVGTCTLVHPAYFSVSTFNGFDPTDVAFEGLAMPGDSGAIVFDALTGEALGMVVSQSGSRTNILSFSYLQPHMNAFMAVPEPSTGVMLGLGLAGLHRYGRRRRNASR